MLVNIRDRCVLLALILCFILRTECFPERKFDRELKTALQEVNVTVADLCHFCTSDAECSSGCCVPIGPNDEPFYAFCAKHRTKSLPCINGGTLKLDDRGLNFLNLCSKGKSRKLTYTEAPSSRQLEHFPTPILPTLPTGSGINWTNCNCNQTTTTTQSPTTTTTKATTTPSSTTTKPSTTITGLTTSITTSTTQGTTTAITTTTTSKLTTVSTPGSTTVAPTTTTTRQAVTDVATVPAATTIDPDLYLLNNILSILNIAAPVALAALLAGIAVLLATTVGGPDGLNGLGKFFQGIFQTIAGIPAAIGSIPTAIVGQITGGIADMADYEYDDEDAYVSKPTTTSYGTSAANYGAGAASYGASATSYGGTDNNYGPSATSYGADLGASALSYAASTGNKTASNLALPPGNNDPLNGYGAPPTQNSDSAYQNLDFSAYPAAETYKSEGDFNQGSYLTPAPVNYGAQPLPDTDSYSQNIPSTGENSYSAPEINGYDLVQPTDGQYKQKKLPGLSSGGKGERWVPLPLQYSQQIDKPSTLSVVTGYSGTAGGKLKESFETPSSDKVKNLLRPSGGFSDQNKLSASQSLSSNADSLPPFGAFATDFQKRIGKRNRTTRSVSRMDRLTKSSNERQAIGTTSKVVSHKQVKMGRADDFQLYVKNDSKLRLETANQHAIGRKGFDPRTPELRNSIQPLIQRRLRSMAVGLRRNLVRPFVRRSGKATTKKPGKQVSRA